MKREMVAFRFDSLESGVRVLLSILVQGFPFPLFIWFQASGTLCKGEAFVVEWTERKPSDQHNANDVQQKWTATSLMQHSFREKKKLKVPILSTSFWVDKIQWFLIKFWNRTFQFGPKITPRWYLTELDICAEITSRFFAVHPQNRHKIMARENKHVENKPTTIPISGNNAGATSPPIIISITMKSWNSVMSFQIPFIGSSERVLSRAVRISILNGGAAYSYTHNNGPSPADRNGYLGFHGTGRKASGTWTSRRDIVIVVKKNLKSVKCS